MVCLYSDFLWAEVVVFVMVADVDEVVWWYLEDVADLLINRGVFFDLVEVRE